MSKRLPPERIAQLRKDLETRAALVYTDLKERKKLGEARDAGVDLMRAIGLLSGLLSSSVGGGDGPILLAKDACEELAERACRASENGDTEFAEVLNNHAQNLAGIAVKLFQELPNSTGNSCG